MPAASRTAMCWSFIAALLGAWVAKCRTLGRHGWDGRLGTAGLGRQAWDGTALARTMHHIAPGASHESDFSLRGTCRCSVSRLRTVFRPIERRSAGRIGNAAVHAFEHVDAVELLRKGPQLERCIGRAQPKLYAR